MSNKKGVSSAQLGRDLQISQKGAWFMSMRIKATLGIENDENDGFDSNSIVEVDETFVGGKNKNRHKDKKVAQSQGRAFLDKRPILGALKRGKKETILRPNKQIPSEWVAETKVIEYSQVRLKVAGNTKGETLQQFLNNVVEKDAVLFSDEWQGYNGAEKNYDHHVIDHAKKQYVDFFNPEIHTNGIEGFWGILKRGYNGIYNWWSPKHMQKYADEFAWRFNLRGMQNGERFNYLLLNSAVRTKYKDLTKCLD